VIHESKFVLSHHPYAIDPNGLRITGTFEGTTGTWYSCRLTAVWFRRRRGAGCGPLVTVACVGELWDSRQPQPADAAMFLAQHDDGRYGGDCKGRWDGKRYWGSQEPDEITRHLELLRPMLANYPACPPGYDGWWRF
jgi:hypothetical protein